ncbi:MAG: retroviral-like aspartic protease family protein, partial [gamma proteobacterium symbiont of Lucinoma myriamae]|nr:retroviral-like aspartic protease family protein [gamma proteobacterium symbiont of Lucinoma myriamae]
MSCTDNLVGPSNEIDVQVNGVDCKALLDTGSTVTTISEQFYDNYLSNVTIKPLESILTIECADGQNLPYKGYVEVELCVSGIENSQIITCLALIVPKSNYNSKVPLLLGTNVLSMFLDMCKQKYGDKMLQDAQLFTPWFLCFRTMLLQEKELKRHKNVLGYVKSAESKSIIIPPDTTKVLAGCIDKGLKYHTTCALLQATTGSVLTNDLDVCPTLITYDGHGKGLVDVHVSNITTRTVNVQPNGLLCEIQPVQLEDGIDSKLGQVSDSYNEDLSFIDKI